MLPVDRAKSRIKELVGHNMLIEEGVALSRCDVMSNIKIGYMTYANYSFLRSGVSIGRYCSIGRRSTIGAMHHPTDWLTTHPVGYGSNEQFTRETFVGNDVWVGDNVVILNGLSIGDGAVIGAGAIVTRDVKPYEIVAGVPAKPLRFRFPAGHIDRLISLKWWEYHPSILDNINFKDVDAALSELERRVATAAIFPPHHKKFGKTSALRARFGLLKS
jgi:acetyltransferase-like isoleucine patch superfamily enzyme